MNQKARRTFFIAAALVSSAMPRVTTGAPRASAAPVAQSRDGKADAAYKEAKEAYQKLKGDPSRRKFRHHWQNVARRFEAVAAKYEKSDRAPEALYNAAELNQELSRFSQNAEDLAAAVRSYEKLIEKWPKHKLADDSAYALGRVKADRLGDVAGARKALKLAAAGKGDKAGEAKSLLAALPAEPAPRERAEKAPAKEAPREKEQRPAQKSASQGAPQEADRRAAADEPAKAPQLRLSDAVADAIRRVGRPAEADQESGAERAARRAPVQREEEPLATREADTTVEERGGPVLETLSERLRDVRVGQPVDDARDADARARLKKMSRQQAASELTLAEQLGLKVRRVVIDAGHGGHDTGAIGPSGVQEKEVSLAIALKLKARLEKAGLEVVLTRDDDSYVKLEDRTQLANRHKGDLFISVHCNAAPTRKLRGIETYTLNTSSDRYAIRLAARENSTSEKGVSDLQFILADLATKANTEESDRLASGVQKTLVRNLKGKHPGIKDLGQKEALFFVLLGARMPAILVETAFLSNPEEEKLLASKEYQDDVAQAIADGVQGFLDERARLARVD